MIDFSKLKPPTHHEYVTYTCAECGKSVEFVQRMPKDWKCDRPCNGPLVEISSRTVTHEEHMR